MITGLFSLELWLSFGAGILAIACLEFAYRRASSMAPEPSLLLKRSTARSKMIPIGSIILVLIVLAGVAFILIKGHDKHASGGATPTISAKPAGNAMSPTQKEDAGVMASALLSYNNITEGLDAISKYNIKAITIDKSDAPERFPNTFIITCAFYPSISREYSIDVLYVNSGALIPSLAASLEVIEKTPDHAIFKLSPTSDNMLAYRPIGQSLWRSGRI
jgi:hypothetical protein